MHFEERHLQIWREIVKFLTHEGHVNKPTLETLPKSLPKSDTAALPRDVELSKTNAAIYFHFHYPKEKAKG